MNYKVLVSIILPTYNRAGYIRRAIESVLSQTYKNFELIIINDNSTDKTENIISHYQNKDSRIKIIANTTNIGFVKSLNKGIKKSKGQYIARIDDDDFWCDEGKLEKQIGFLEEHQNYVLVGGGIIKIDENGKEFVRHLLPKEDEDIRKLILLDDCFAHSAVVFKKKTWEKVNGYNEKLTISQDWDLWMKFGKLGKFYNFQEYFICYLQGKQNRSNFNIRANLKRNIKLRKKYSKNYPNFQKAFLLGWVYYLYTFIPFRHFLKPIFSKMRRVILGPPVYKSFKS